MSDPLRNVQSVWSQRGFFLHLRRMKSVWSMKRSSVPCVQVGQPGSFLKQALPSCWGHGAVSGCSKGQSKLYPSVPGRTKNNFQSSSHFRASYLFQLSLFFPNAEEKLWMNLKENPAVTEGWVLDSVVLSMMCHALDWVSQYRFLPSYRIPHLNAKTIFGAYLRDCRCFLTAWILLCEIVFDTYLLFYALS